MIRGFAAKDNRIVENVESEERERERKREIRRELKERALVDAGKKYLWRFEFEPYPVQKEFMNHLYDTLESGGIGILESPTGTGKSLSIICSSLHWLQQNRFKSPKSCKNKKKDNFSNDPDWITSFRARKAEADEKAAACQREELVARVTKRKRKRKRRRVKKVLTTSDDEFAPSSESDASDSEAYSSSSCEEEEEEEEEAQVSSSPARMQLFFCSRTHSQLSQFINEIKRTPFAKDLSCVALGSRQQLCSNAQVRELGGNVTNEACMELVDKARGPSGANNKKKEGSQKRQRYVPPESRGDLLVRIPKRSACPKYNRDTVLQLRDQLLVEPVDIESLGKMADKIHSCGYFASRGSIHDADVITLPYSMLLSKSTRKSLGISLKNSIVVCDEAHNLVEAINETYSARVSLSQLSRAHAELAEYRERYCTRLKHRNKVGINNLLFLVRGLSNMLRHAVAKNGGPGAMKTQPSIEVFPTGELTIRAQVDHINLFQVLDYIDKAQLCRKLRGFAQKYLVANHGQVVVGSGGSRRVQPVKQDETAVVTPQSQKRRTSSALVQVKNFLQGICNSDQDGRAIISIQDGEAHLKFMMLNPGLHFNEIVEDARAVILAGGTMQPVKEVVKRLFDQVESERIRIFSCGHVIPKENLGCICLPQGPTGRRLELSFANRQKPSIMEEIGLCLVNIAGITPAGVVVFLPSYSYAGQLFAQWRKTETWNRLGKKKALFFESQGNLETLLTSYHAACHEPQGAMLFAVVGGKLSEGINFKDDLARCVVMVGLPYPNPRDPQLRAKMEYLDKTLGKRAGQEYFENQCMKAVNQSIGRAIRHRNDYAAIVLLDGRYTRPDIQAKLPTWVATEITVAPSFGKFHKDLRGFFLRK